MNSVVRRSLPQVWIGLALLAITLSPGRPASAQQTTGKIQGSVTNQAGEVVAKAQVLVVGTAFGAVTDDKGYYFINNLPAGTYTFRAQFIGYAPSELSGARVLSGQTITFDFKMLPSAVVVGGINVVAAANPIVPRDNVTSKSTITGDLISSLPVSNLRSVITLQPGVVESGNGLGVSIRGGRPGEANVYIDGAPVRVEGATRASGAMDAMGGGQAIQVQTNGVEEASVTTGALPVQFGDAQSGVISFTTRSGGEKFAGSFGAQTDGMMGNSTSLGYNRFEGSLGGPIPGVQNLRFFLSGVLEGQSTCGAVLNQSCAGRPLGAADVPSYTTAGIDTTVSVNAPGTGIQRVTLPRFVQYSGQCDAAQNAGVACQGQGLPDNWNTAINLSGKLSYSYGSGSSVALSGIATGQQSREWPGSAIADPAFYNGDHNWARSVTANWQHSVFKAADHALSLSAIFSYGTNQNIGGHLDPASDAATRNPLGGIEFSSLTFGTYGSFASDFFNNPEQIVRNIRNGSGERIPLLNRTELQVSQPYRMNPYGMATGAFWTQGVDDPGANSNILSQDRRYYGQVNVDWQANRYQRFNIGGELKQSEVASWRADFVSQIFMQAFYAKPKSGAAWASDRLDLGDVVVDLGLRYDYFNSESLFPNTPGFTFSNPLWNPAAGTNDTAYQNSLSRVFTPGVGHSVLSPRIGVSFPITDQTDFHLSYSHQVQSPNIATLLNATNSDLTNTNSNDFFGRDVGFGKTIQFEFGARHAFSPDLVLDVAAYNKSKVADLSYRLFQFDDPTNPGRSRSINVLTTGDFGYDRGVDMKLDRRLGNWLSASVAYTFEVAAGTGSDPLTYLNTNARSISGVTGTVLPPAEQARAVNDQRSHNLVGSVSFTVPQGWQQGTTVGSIFKNVSAFVTFRVLSGLPYTPLTNVGGGATAPGTTFGLTATQAGDINSASTPWTKYLDLRLNKGLKLGRVEVTAFADIRNLFNFKNITGLFAETNDVTNLVFEHNTIAGEFVKLANEASANGALRSDGAVTLNNCGGWGGAAGPVDCVELQRTEARFGNGDGVYTVAEQTKALDSYYNLFAGGTYLFNDLPRSVRLGFQLNF
jgi:hypothetical protein